MPADLPSLDQWLHQLTGRQLPAFARTAQRIASKSLDADSSTADLAALILQDLSMTTRLLRMANSVLFNPGSGRIGTVSRAIIVLGFDTVRDLCLSIAVIDGLLSGPNRHLVARGMGLALHAALQARNLAQLRRLPESEEVFVATLLSHLGELALMCLAGDQHADLLPRLTELHRLPAAERGRAELELLGFPLRELTGRLNREWRLSGLLARALEPSASTDPRTQSVHFGNALADCLTRHGSGEALDRLVDETCKALQLEPERLRQSVLSTFHSGNETSQSLGAGTALAEAGANANAAAPAPRWSDGDAAVQMAVLRELSQLLVETRPSVSALMALVLEGLFRGVGFDRVVFLLLSADRQALHQKAALRIEHGGPEAALQFAARPAAANPFAHALEHDLPLWIGGPGQPALVVDPALQRLCGGHCLIMPLAVAGTAIGCLYADRAPSGRTLNEELFAQFRMFGQQARMGLTLIKGR